MNDILKGIFFVGGFIVTLIGASTIETDMLTGFIIALFGLVSVYAVVLTTE